MQTILDKVTCENIVLEPFPHIVMENALDNDLYSKLSSTFPRQCFPETKDSNSYSYYKANRALRENKIDKLWLEFIRLHTSKEFFNRILFLFGDILRNLHPELENKLGKKLEKLTPKVRDFKRFSFRPLSLDCQLACCSPVTRTARAIRSAGNDAGPHIDRPVAMFAGLLYFRLPEDTSSGGDLQLYKCLSEKPVYDHTNHVPDDIVECFRTVKYAPNTMVFFLNSPYSIHGVSVREITKYPRIHVNFIGELPFPIFEIDKIR